jgi:hypothetical protein
MYLTSNLSRKSASNPVARLKVANAVSSMQDVTMPAVAAMGKGCKWNQDLTSLLAAAGLEVTKLRTSLAGVITLVEAKKI